MATIKAFSEEHEAAVREFNTRLKQGGSPFKFPAKAAMPWPPRVEGRTTFMEGFVAVEDEMVRGGFLIKHQPFSLLGAMREDVRNIQLPLSEGSVDPAFNRVGVQVLATAVRKNPLLYALGMGGIHTPLPSVLRSMGWTLMLVPFFFRVVRPSPFLRNIKVIRTTTVRKIALDAAAATGIGTLVLRPLHMVLARPTLRRPRAEVVDKFGDWADEIWRRAYACYSMIARRDAGELNALYMQTDRRPIRLRVFVEGRTVGWAVVFATQLANHKQFESMYLGTIVDCLALPGEEVMVVQAATRYLVDRKVDLIISNQIHIAWRDALRQRGYLVGPSNYGFAVSRGLATALHPWEANVDRIHMTRGDGDGPIHI